MYVVEGCSRGATGAAPSPGIGGTGGGACIGGAGGQAAMGGETAGDGAIPDGPAAGCTVSETDMQLERTSSGSSGPGSLRSKNTGAGNIGVGFGATTEPLGTSGIGGC